MSGWTAELPAFPEEAAAAARRALAERRGARFRDPKAQRVFLERLARGWARLKAYEAEPAPPIEAARDRAARIARMAEKLASELGKMDEALQDCIDPDGRLRGAVADLSDAAAEHADALTRGRGGDPGDPAARLIASAGIWGWFIAFGRWPSASARGAFGQTINAVFAALGFQPIGDDALRSLLGRANLQGQSD